MLILNLAESRVPLGRNLLGIIALQTPGRNLLGFIALQKGEKNK
jgi:hypothetical protein